MLVPRPRTILRMMGHCIGGPTSLQLFFHIGVPETGGAFAAAAIAAFNRVAKETAPIQLRVLSLRLSSPLERTATLLLLVLSDQGSAKEQQGPQRRLSLAFPYKLI